MTATRYEAHLDRDNATLDIAAVTGETGVEILTEIPFDQDALDVESHTTVFVDRLLEGTGWTRTDNGTATPVGVSFAIEREAVTLGDLATGERLLTAEQIVALIGWESPRSWHAYVSRGRAPAPDAQVGRTPVWRESTITVWIADR